VKVKAALLLTLLAPLLASTDALAADPIEAKAKICATCHGENGVPQLKTTPVIAGQDAGYLFYQLRDFKSGSRKNDLMSPIAATLEREDLLPLAEYFSKQKWPNLQQPAAADDVAAKAQSAISSVGASAVTSSTSRAMAPRPA
jgi:cytochrome c553